MKTNTVKSVKIKDLKAGDYVIVDCTSALYKGKNELNDYLFLKTHQCDDDFQNYYFIKSEFEGDAIVKRLGNYIDYFANKSQEESKND